MPEMSKSLVLFAIFVIRRTPHLTSPAPNAARKSPAISHSPQEVAFLTPATSYGSCAVLFPASFIDYRNNSIIIVARESAVVLLSRISHRRGTCFSFGFLNGKLFALMPTDCGHDIGICKFIPKSSGGFKLFWK